MNLKLFSLILIVKKVKSQSIIFLFLSLLGFSVTSYCVSGKEACGGDTTLDPSTNCLPFTEEDQGEDGANTEEEESQCELIGSGTVKSPYIVCDYFILQRIGRDLPIDGVYIMNKDIDASASCGPRGCDYPSGFGSIIIGNAESEEAFIGTFNGNGHTIKNLYINRPLEKRVGLFGRVAKGARIINLKFKKPKVHGGARVGILVGEAKEAILKKITIEEGIVTAREEEGGGVAGYVKKSILDEIYFSGSVSGKKKMGGLVGALVSSMGREGAEDSLGISNSEVKDSAVLGSISVGGLVGFVKNSKIQDSSVSKSDESEKNDPIPPDVAGKENVGGLVGFLESASVISNSYSSVYVSALTLAEDGEKIGGLVGFAQDSFISSSHATDDVKGRASVGGLVGEIINGEVTKSYSESRVLGSSKYVGGLIGKAVANDPKTWLVKESYATGNVGGSVHSQNFSASSVSSLVGYAKASIKKSYATGKLVGRSKVGGLVGHLASGTLFQSYALLEKLQGLGSEIGGLVGLMDGEEPSPSIEEVYIKIDDFFVGNGNHVHSVGNLVGSAKKGAQLLRILSLSDLAKTGEASDAYLPKANIGVGLLIGYCYKANVDRIYYRKPSKIGEYEFFGRSENNETYSQDNCYKENVDTGDWEPQGLLISGTETALRDQLYEHLVNRRSLSFAENTWCNLGVKNKYPELKNIAHSSTDCDPSEISIDKVNNIYLSDIENEGYHRSDFGIVWDNIKKLGIIYQLQEKIDGTWQTIAYIEEDNEKERTSWDLKNVTFGLHTYRVLPCYTSQDESVQHCATTGPELNQDVQEFPEIEIKIIPDPEDRLLDYKYRVRWPSQHVSTDYEINYKLQEKIDDNDWQDIPVNSDNLETQGDQSYISFTDKEGPHLYTYQLKICIKKVSTNTEPPCASWTQKTSKNVTLPFVVYTEFSEATLEGEVELSWYPIGREKFKRYPDKINFYKEYVKYQLECKKESDSEYSSCVQDENGNVQKFYKGNNADIYNAETFLYTATIRNLEPDKYIFRMRACSGPSSDLSCNLWKEIGDISIEKLSFYNDYQFYSDEDGSLDYDGEYTLHWDRLPKATSYELERCLLDNLDKPCSDNANWSNILTANKDKFTYFVDDAEGKSYAYKLRACAGSRNCTDWEVNSRSWVSVTPAEIENITDLASNKFLYLHGEKMKLHWKIDESSPANQVYQYRFRKYKEDANWGNEIPEILIDTTSDEFQRIDSSVDQNGRKDVIYAIDIPSALGKYQFQLRACLEIPESATELLCGDWENKTLDVYIGKLKLSLDEVDGNNSFTNTDPKEVAISQIGDYTLSWGVDVGADISVEDLEEDLAEALSVDSFSIYYGLQECVKTQADSTKEDCTNTDWSNGSIDLDPDSDIKENNTTREEMTVKAGKSYYFYRIYASDKIAANGTYVYTKDEGYYAYLANASKIEVKLLAPEWKNWSLTPDELSTTKAADYQTDFSILWTNISNAKAYQLEACRMSMNATTDTFLNEGPYAGPCYVYNNITGEMDTLWKDLEKGGTTITASSNPFTQEVAGEEIKYTEQGATGHANYFYRIRSCNDTDINKINDDSCSSWSEKYKKVPVALLATPPSNSLSVKPDSVESNGKSYDGTFTLTLTIEERESLILPTSSPNASNFFYTLIKKGKRKQDGQLTVKESDTEKEVDYGDDRDGYPKILTGSHTYYLQFCNEASYNHVRSEENDTTCSQDIPQDMEETTIPQATVDVTRLKSLNLGVQIEDEGNDSNKALNKDGKILLAVSDTDELEDNSDIAWKTYAYNPNNDTNDDNIGVYPNYDQNYILRWLPKPNAEEDTITGKYLLARNKKGNDITPSWIACPKNYPDKDAPNSDAYECKVVSKTTLEILEHEHDYDDKYTYTVSVCADEDDESLDENGCTFRGAETDPKESVTVGTFDLDLEDPYLLGYDCNPDPDPDSDPELTGSRGQTKRACVPNAASDRQYRYCYQVGLGLDSNATTDIANLKKYVPFYYFREKLPLTPDLNEETDTSLLSLLENCQKSDKIAKAKQLTQDSRRLKKEYDGAYDYEIKLCGYRGQCGDFGNKYTLNLGSFAGGDGKSENTAFSIETYEQLKEIDNGKKKDIYYKLRNDIDANDSYSEGSTNPACIPFKPDDDIGAPLVAPNNEKTFNYETKCAGWKPITDEFQGQLDGSDKTIHGLYMNRYSDENVGLFSKLGPKGLIKNLKLENVQILGHRTIGAFVGLSKGKLENVHVISGKIVGKEDTKGSSLSGSDLSKEEKVKANYLESKDVGGLIGKMAGASTVSQSSVRYDVEIDGGKNTGGLVGFLSSSSADTSLKRSFSAARSVEGKSLLNTFSMYDIKVNVSEVIEANVGGLVGHLRKGTIKNTYSTSDVKAPEDPNEFASHSNVGGLVGLVSAEAEDILSVAKIQNSYATGIISGSVVGGSLIGNFTVNAKEDTKDTFSYANLNLVLNSFSTSTLNIVGDETKYPPYIASHALIGKLLFKFLKTETATATDPKICISIDASGDATIYSEDPTKPDCDSIIPTRDYSEPDFNSKIPTSYYSDPAFNPYKYDKEIDELSEKEPKYNKNFGTIQLALNFFDLDSHDNFDAWSDSNNIWENVSTDEKLPCLVGVTPNCPNGEEADKTNRYCKLPENDGKRKLTFPQTGDEDVVNKCSIENIILPYRSDKETYTLKDNQGDFQGQTSLTCRESDGYIISYAAENDGLKCEDKRKTICKRRYENKDPHWSEVLWKKESETGCYPTEIAEKIACIGSEDLYWSYKIIRRCFETEKKAKEEICASQHTKYWSEISGICYPTMEIAEAKCKKDGNYWSLRLSKCFASRTLGEEADKTACNEDDEKSWSSHLAKCLSTEEYLAVKACVDENHYWSQARNLEEGVSNCFNTQTELEAAEAAANEKDRIDCLSEAFHWSSTLKKCFDTADERNCRESSTKYWSDTIVENEEKGKCFDRIEDAITAENDQLLDDVKSECDTDPDSNAYWDGILGECFDGFDTKAEAQAAAAAAAKEKKCRDKNKYYFPSLDGDSPDGDGCFPTVEAAEEKCNEKSSALIRYDWKKDKGCVSSPVFHCLAVGGCNGGGMPVGPVLRL